MSVKAPETHLSVTVSGRIATLTDTAGRSVTLDGDGDVRGRIFDHARTVAAHNGASVHLVTDGDLGHHAFTVSVDGAVHHHELQAPVEEIDESTSAWSDRSRARELLSRLDRKPRVVTVLSPHRGGGADTVAAMLAATVGYFRGAGAVVWDNHPGVDSLALRTQKEAHGKTEQHLLYDLLGQPEHMANVNARAYTHRQVADRYEVLRGSNGYQITAEQADFLIGYLRGRYPVTVIDSGATTPVRWSRSVANADSLVIAASGDPEAVATTAATLRNLEVQNTHVAGLARRATVAVFLPPKPRRATVQHIEQTLAAEHRKVFFVPPEAAGSELSFTALRERERGVWTDITARAMRARGQ